MILINTSEKWYFVWRLIWPWVSGDSFRTFWENLHNDIIQLLFTVFVYVVCNVFKIDFLPFSSVLQPVKIPVDGTCVCTVRVFQWRNFRKCFIVVDWWIFFLAPMYYCLSISVLKCETEESYLMVRSHNVIFSSHFSSDFLIWFAFY